ncbi:ABC transporter ATP-binding protein [Malaciobacter pacificus]|jgi:putative ABC transport system ATP-binding protein|uniref:ABC transporter, ATP-binding protein, FtsE/LolD family n=1 Tax=Malaciobacter pacificus TaxID=1080223 RepID=A0A5C2H944_9BACT|nr:ABC transporter ATP-binding protein [Malaciobacter pacificus]QEP33394.1 ABC transporter, ATP-binding protein, FtsE/LolD family [Malaciobacter pacificus]GGD31086.1 ABC transporter ATP-binding protein [Malaciobacter pacificus]
MIEIKNLNKIFNEDKKNQFHALKDINLKINSNSCVILKGISGSGKSTLLSILATLSKPTNGEIIIDGESIAKLPDIHASNFRANKIGFIFQSYNLFNELNVYQNVSIPLVPLNLSNKQLDEKTSKALKIANISHKKDELVYNLSGGEKQRCAIARALVNNPDIILCDEPTANLDLENSKKFIEALRSLKKLNKTIIVATHDPIFDDLDFVDEVINIADGKICE